MIYPKHFLSSLIKKCFGEVSHKNYSGLSKDLLMHKNSKRKTLISGQEIARKNILIALD